MARYQALFIDDEFILRELTCELVQDFGAVPIALPSADEGLSYLEHQAAEIRLVVTDVRVPELPDGHQLTQLITERLPALPVVVTSGLDGEQIRTLPQNACFLTKPWEFVAVIQPHLQYRATVRRW